MYMIIVVIVGSMILGWFVGNILVDKWINNGMDEANEDVNSSDSH